MKSYLIGTVIAACVATSAAASTLTNTFTSFVVLGDSLSDNGNLPPTAAPPPPYFAGKFTNGDVWNEAIAAEFTAAGLLSQNFAFGGAKTTSGGFAPPSLDEQVALTFSNIPPAALGDNPLFSIWAGANDIFGPLDAGTPELAPAIAEAAADNVAATIFDLSLLGVDDFLVFNLPDIGQTPSYPGDADASLASAVFNTKLADNILGLEAIGLNIIEVDIASLFKDAVANPASYGLTNVDDACVFNLFTTCDPNSWLFWDTVHPTAFGHKIVETEVRAVLNAELSAVPVPAALPLLFAGIAALGLFGRRGKVA
ncbi:outer membrane lipase/esterase [Litoreibacter meonggei]|uniref:Outer membrane lipase/esterase n=1 Tax=Litoreibacter meonggei TaxID=1049199 RepID=A0A497WRF6_9RHOB|nr:SGNH/GDSL hydrolase family protein [Litoreibacter meonggei]RLJ51864.1 outer membrane lipase/esterase [Litoreibacter meonggei]